MKFALMLCALLASSTIYAQQNPWNAVNMRRDKLAKNGVYILGSYAAANVIYGSIAAGSAHGDAKFFHEMNAIFNGVTLGILGAGLLTAKKSGDLTYTQSLQKQQGVERLFLFNTGLDLAYVAGGAYLKERGKSRPANKAKLTGYGNSIMVQGGVLFLFDGVMFLLHKRNGSALYNMDAKVRFGSAPGGVGLMVNL